MLKTRTCGYTLRSIIYRSKHRRLLFTFVGVILWCCIVLPVFYAFLNEPGNTIHEYSPSDTKNRINIEIDLLSMDPAARTANMLARLYPQGDYSSGGRRLATNLTVDFLYKSLRSKSSTTIEPVNLMIPFTTGFLREFPFGQYNSKFPIIIYTQNDTTITDVPFNVKLGGASQLFGIVYEIFNAKEAYPDSYQFYDLNPETTIVSVTLKRTPSIIAICIVTTILMWGITIALMNIAWDSVFYRREATVAILGLGVITVIALPAFRNAQPGIPTTICILDMLGFFWCICLSLLSTTVIIFCYVLSWKPEFMKADAEFS